MSTPNLYDEVKHVKNDTIGTVIAKYKNKGKDYFDVRVGAHIRYLTPAQNWATVRKEEDTW